MIKIGLEDYQCVCSIMSGLGIKNPLQEHRVGTNMMYGWKIFGNWNMARSYWNARKSHSVPVHKMQENAWRPGLCPGPLLGELTAFPPTSTSTPPPLSALWAPPVLVPNFIIPQAKIMAMGLLTSMLKAAWSTAHNAITREFNFLMNDNTVVHSPTSVILLLSLDLKQEIWRLHVSTTQLFSHSHPDSQFPTPNLAHAACATHTYTHTHPSTPDC